MSDADNARLRYWWYWFGLGFCLILLVVYLSLADIQLPQVPSSIGDKVNHLIAYAVLTGWFGQLFTAGRPRLLASICLIGLGVSMEYLQGRTGYRFFEWRDASANTVGVLIGCLALALGADRILLWFERRFLIRWLS